MSKIVPVIVLSSLLGVLSGCASQPPAKPEANLQEQLAKAEADRKAAQAAADKSKAEADALRKEVDRLKEESSRAKKSFRKGLKK
ncbi:MAG: hypothetical protein HQM06_09460 [Magnetococcales bacterium]|nr:hypothetical protein [Magnetococcales bacterium]